MDFSFKNHQIVSPTATLIQSRFQTNCHPGKRSWAFGLKRKRSLACFQGSKKIPDRDRKRSLGFFRDRKRYQGFYLACFSMFLSGIFLWEQGSFLRDFLQGFSSGVFQGSFSRDFLLQQEFLHFLCFLSILQRLLPSDLSKICQK